MSSTPAPKSNFFSINPFPLISLSRLISKPNPEYKPSTQLLIIIDKIGVVFSVIYFLTPLLHVIKNGCHRNSLKKIPFLLLFSICINCVSYMVFSLRDGNGIFLSMLICNGLGLSINFFLVMTYTFQLLTVWKFIGFFVFFSMVIIDIFCFFYLLIEDMVIVVICSSVVNTLMYTSPCVVLFKAWKNKEKEKNKMPMITNVIGFITCCIWLLYGIMSKHTQAYVSNGVSIMSLSIQIFLWIKHFKKIKKENEIKFNKEYKESKEYLNESGDDDNIKINNFNNLSKITISSDSSDK